MYPESERDAAMSEDWNNKYGPRRSAVPRPAISARTLDEPIFAVRGPAITDESTERTGWKSSARR